MSTGIQSVGTPNENRAADKIQSYNASKGSFKTILAVPLKVEVEQGIEYCYVYLENTAARFEYGTSTNELKPSKSANKYGKVRLHPDGSTMSIVAQDKIFMGQVEITYSDQSGKNIISSSMSFGILKIHPSFTGMDQEEVMRKNSKSRLRAQKLVENFVRRHERLSGDAPGRMVIPTSKPKTGIMKDLYLESIGNPSSVRVNSMYDEWSLLKRGLKNATDPSKINKRITEGFSGWGLLEQSQSSSEFKVKSEAGVEVFGMSPQGEDDQFMQIKHSKLDPSAMLFENKRFNTFLKHFPSTSIRPIRQWVEGIGNLEASALKSMVTLFSVVSVIKKFEDIKTK